MNKILVGKTCNRRVKDHKTRLCVLKYEPNIITLKTLQKHGSISKQRKYQIGLALSKIPAKASRVRVINRCVLTGRARGVFNFFKVSRIMVKELAAQALLPGVKKAN